MKHKILLIILLTAAALLFGQNEGSAKMPETELPPLIIEVETENVFRLNPLIPQGELLPELPGLLEESGLEIKIPVPEIRLTDNDMLKLLPEDGENYFFSDGTLGIGNSNHTYAGLNIYKTGKYPRYNAGFFHEKIDGYNFREAGSGYFSSENLFSGSFQTVFKAALLTAEASYLEKEDGLQNKSTSWTSAVSRNIEAEAGLMPASGSFPLSFLMKAAGSTRIFTGLVPFSRSETRLTPQLKAAFDLGSVQFDGRLLYDFTAFEGAFDQLKAFFFAGAGLAWEVSPGFLIRAESGLYYDEAAAVRGPFSLSFDLHGSKGFYLSLSGGYDFKPSYYSLIAIVNPYISELTELETDFIWFGKAAVETPLFNIFRLNLYADYEKHEKAGELSSAADSEGLYSIARQPQDIFKIKSRLSAALNDNWEAGVKFERQFLDVPVFTESMLLGFDTLFKDAQGRASFSTEFVVPCYKAFLLPDWKIKAVLAVNRLISFILEGSELLNPLADYSRKINGLYETPGFALTFKTEISF